tara:strand:+ start:1510 stop:1701 length:192 start_codon:yes stop_codon:yes gene_type:complete
MKVVNLKEYKNQKEIEKQIKELDRIGELQYPHMTPTEQKGYRNFMCLLKAVEAKYGKPDCGGE